jgi:gluconate:H+ symporter, GntP family
MKLVFMVVSFTHVSICLIVGIAVIVLLTTRFRVHAFFALMIAAFLTGLGLGMPLGEVILVTKDGFGNIMKSLGLIIVLGTTLGVVLEHTGSTGVIASFILKKTGEKKASLAMSITGFLVGLPVFCDSGFIVLSGLNRPFSARKGIPYSAIPVSLATGLYAVHCLIPPHPGASAAAGTIGVDLGKLILTGIPIAIPAMLVGHLWAVYAGRKFPNPVAGENASPEDERENPSLVRSMLPILVPVILIALKSFFTLGSSFPNSWMNIFLSLGDPVIALSIGVLLAFNCKRGWNKNSVGTLFRESAEKAGGILVIIGAGGAFGSVLAASNAGLSFSQAINLGTAGIFFPFLLCFILKTAQGSSTVAIITAASMVQPLLPALGLESPTGKLLCVLSMGAGSMMISHANDAYFWVIAKFSGLEMKTMLRVYTISTVLMGFTAFAIIYILSLLFL